MSEIEKEMAELEEERKLPNWYRHLSYDAVDTSLQALHEKAEREKGCEYCRSEKIVKCSDGAQTKMFLAVGGGSVKHAILFEPDDYDQRDMLMVNYCPMCGRKLEVDK